MKTCSVCKVEKELSEFGVLLRNKDGMAGRCKPCARFAVAATKEKNGLGKVDPTKAAERARRFYARNPDYGRRQFAKHREKINARTRAYQLANKVALNAAQLAKYKTKTAKRGAEFVGPMITSRILGQIKRRLWHEAHPHIKTMSVARRRAQKKQAIPSWANDFFIKEAYHLAKLRTRMTGFKWEVDHIYPLQSDVVCGLHVENNFQVIPATLNRSKGNKVIHHG
jgi:hypothetical protein